MQKILLVALICFQFIFQSKAQSSSLDAYSIKLFSGEIIKCDNEISPNDKYIFCHNVKYPVNEVAFYRNDGGIYANAYHLRKTRKYSRFLPQKYTGKLNLYQVTVTSYNNRTRKVGNFNYTETESITDEYFFYSKGVDKLKRATYRHLKVDLKDNKKSMKYVHKLRNVTAVEYGIYALSVASLVTGISILSKDDDSTLGMVSVGLTIPLYYFARIVMPPIKNKKIKKALFAYSQ